MNCLRKWLNDRSYWAGFCRPFYPRYVHPPIWVLGLIVLLAGTGYAADPPSPSGPVRALRLGLAAHDIDGLWSGASKERGPDLLTEVIFNRSLFNLFAATAYPNLGLSLNTRGDTSKLHGGILLQWQLLPALFFSTGLGLALHDGERNTDATDRKSLGSRLLFRIPIEIGYALRPRHRIVLAFDHVSNAGLASPNQGLDTLGVVYAYQF